jgi:NADPH:quinone reductase-like Zn-dependent oxidoreductase
VRIHAASLNLGDWYAVTGRPWVGRAATGLRKPKEERLGTDYAGTVEAVGANVTELHPGDEVFGGRTGALAEHVVARADRAIVTKPANVTFEEAAAVPVAAVTALQGLRDKGGLEPGQRVLINGASGGVGTFAVQLAKALGGEVTAVCNTKSVETARSLGADHVIDYTQEDFTRGDRRYHLLVDIAGGRSWSDCKRILEPQATLVVIGGPRHGRLLGPLGGVVRMRLGAMRSSQKVVFFIAKLTREDMLFLRELVVAGTLTSIIDGQFELSETADAFCYLGEAHPRGKVVVTVGR